MVPSMNPVITPNSEPAQPKSELTRTLLTMTRSFFMWE